MMDLATIRELSREQARRAARSRLRPFVVTVEDLEDWRAGLAAGHNPRWPFPNIGTYVPHGWKESERAPLFCDKCGDGDGGRSASTEDLLAWLRVGYGYAIVEEGEFQLYVGEFVPPNRE